MKRLTDKKLIERFWAVLQEAKKEDHPFDETKNKDWYYYETRINGISVTWWERYIQAEFYFDDESKYERATLSWFKELNQYTYHKELKDDESEFFMYLDAKGKVTSKEWD